MANRHLSRSIALQSLFEWDFHNCSLPKLKEAIPYNIDEFGPGLSDEGYIKNLIDGILAKQKTLDEIIVKAAPEWPIEKVSLIDRNVLRVGLFELLYANRKEVPPKVAINEAIELAKAFGGENSGKFVNGVLGTVYKEIGEPGKDDSGTEGRDPSKMPKEFLGGALVFRKSGTIVYLAFVHDVFGYWTLSKGHIDEGEDLAEGTKREIKEELGIDVTIIEKIGENEYTASDPERGKIRKHVSYFLAETSSTQLMLSGGGGLDQARWFTLNEVFDLKMYGDILPIITQGIKRITEITHDD